MRSTAPVPARFRGRDVRVVARVRVQTTNEARDERVLVHQERRVLRPLMRGIGRVRGARWKPRRAEAAESVRGQDRGRVRELGGEAAGRPVLQMAEPIRHPWAQEIGPPHGAEQHRAPRERRHRQAILLEHVRHMGGCVAGRVPRPQVHRADGDGFPVSDGAPRISDRFACGDNVRGPRGPAQIRPSRDVVVVDVGFEHVAQRAAVLVQHRQHTIDIPLRIHHHRVCSSDDDVAPIAKLGGCDRGDLRTHP